MDQEHQDDEVSSQPKLITCEGGFRLPAFGIGVTEDEDAEQS